MSVKIRLRRTGRKKQPSYRIVVADSATPRDGQYLDSVGTYNPLTKPADLRIDMEKVEKWLADGAEMSDTAASLIRKARRGGDDKVAVRGVGPETREEVGDVAPAAEPSRSSKPSRPGSRGAPKVEDAAAVAAAPEAAAPEAAAPEAAAPEAELSAAPEPEVAAPEATEDGSDTAEPDATKPAAGTPE